MALHVRCGFDRAPNFERRDGREATASGCPSPVVMVVTTPHRRAGAASTIAHHGVRTRNFLQTAQQVGHLGTDRDIQGGNGFVAHDHLRLEGQRPGDRDALEPVPVPAHVDGAVSE